MTDSRTVVASCDLVGDALYCDEEPFDDLGHVDSGLECGDCGQRPELFLNLSPDDDDDDNELALLLEKEEHGGCGCGEDGEERSRAVEWLVRTNCHHGFSPLTAVLAVDYFDRFVASLGGLRRDIDKPWMGQLVAVACLSLAAKVEEVEVPLLVDLQVEESEYVFEAKTVQRTELLVLSTLKWKMNPVNPVCYFNHIFRRIAVRTNVHWEFLWRCERLLISAILDSRCKRYSPSVLATAIMRYVIQEVAPWSSTKFQNQLMDVLKMNKERVDGCYEFLAELFSNEALVRGGTCKRRCDNSSTPGSPSAVIGVSFSCESSNDSWAVMASTFMSSSEPPFKRRRAQDQLMRLH
uniref:Cyclin-like domain-containing protein n=1 Tax=Kalanchoe fedtschenkoi TaxID=63787 RepID=A0A7N0UDJ7_KALFE